MSISGGEHKYNIYELSNEVMCSQLHKLNTQLSDNNETQKSPVGNTDCVNYVNDEWEKKKKIYGFMDKMMDSQLYKLNGCNVEDENKFM